MVLVTSLSLFPLQIYHHSPCSQCQQTSPFAPLVPKPPYYQPHQLIHYQTGNLGPTLPSTTSDLITPNIKNPIYTTGRGGLGNLAKADPQNPQQARESQDVAPAERGFSQSATFVGRGRSSEAEIIVTRDEMLMIFGRLGGAANVVKPSEDQAQLAKEEKDRKEGKKGGEKKSWWKGIVGTGGAEEEKRGQEGASGA